MDYVTRNACQQWDYSATEGLACSRRHGDRVKIPWVAGEGSCDGPFKWVDLVFRTFCCFLLYTSGMQPALRRRPIIRTYHHLAETRFHSLRQHDGGAPLGFVDSGKFSREWSDSNPSLGQETVPIEFLTYPIPII